ncbi:hypothetical protein Pgy4_31891, partial [Pseudomonas savastanoi pv. glycinea str. race 4]
QRGITVQVFVEWVSKCAWNPHNRFLADPMLAKQTLITHSCEVRNMLRQRSTQTWFVRQQDDYFHHILLSLPGILISAVRACRNNWPITISTSRDKRKTSHRLPGT